MSDIRLRLARYAEAVRHHEPDEGQLERELIAEYQQLARSAHYWNSLVSEDTRLQHMTGGEALEYIQDHLDQIQ